MDNFGDLWVFRGSESVLRWERLVAVGLPPCPRYGHQTLLLHEDDDGTYFLVSDKLMCDGVVIHYFKCAVFTSHIMHGSPRTLANGVMLCCDALYRDLFSSV